MDAFTKAASSMAGNRGSIFIDDAVNIINAAIQMSETCDSVDLVRKLQELRSEVLSGKYSTQKLKEITGCVIDTGRDNAMVELTLCQQEHFKNKHPAAYEEYISGCNGLFIAQFVEEIAKTYPAPKKIKFLYYDAESIAMFWENYKNIWDTSGYVDGDSYAWCYDGSIVHLLHFVDNIFDVGIKLYEPMIEALMHLFITSEDGYVREPAIGLYGFVCERSDNDCIIKLQESEVMKVSWQVLQYILKSAQDGFAKSYIEIPRFKNNLKYCEQ